MTTSDSRLMSVAGVNSADRLQVGEVVSTIPSEWGLACYCLDRLVGAVSSVVLDSWCAAAGLSFSLGAQLSASMWRR